MTKTPLHITMILLLVFLFAAAPATAQTCEAALGPALDYSLDLCEDISLNQACHGQEQVEAELAPSAPETFEFAEPSDITPVEHLDTLITYDATEEMSGSGVAVLNVQAMLPGTLPGQAVIMMMTGDTRVENRVSGEDATAPADPISVTAQYSSVLRSAPDEGGAVMAGVSPGDMLRVDGRSTDGEWLRVLDEHDGVYWIFRDLVSGNTIDSLPDVEQPRMPMQAFYILPGVGMASCRDVPDGVMLQTPAEQDVQFEVNGTPVTVGSTVFIERTEDRLRLYVFDGSAVVENGQVVRTGQRIDGTLSADGTVTGWRRLRPIGTRAAQRFAPFAALPANDLLHYDITVPTGPRTTPLPGTNATSGNSAASGASSYCIDTNGNAVDAGGNVAAFGGGGELAVNSAGDIVPAGNGIYGPYCNAASGSSNADSGDGGGGGRAAAAGSSDAGNGGGDADADSGDGDGGESEED